MKTATERIIETVTKLPDRSAWAYSKMLGISSATVSSTLHRLTEKGVLVRYKGSQDLSWKYYVAKKRVYPAG